jgi:hypothetical protein
MFQMACCFTLNRLDRKISIYRDIQTSTVNSDTWQTTSAAILTGYEWLR